MFDVKTEQGVATARVDGKYMDAARSGEIAGIEFSVERMHMFDSPRSSRHADAVVSLDCTPAVLFQMAMTILDKLDLPAFNEREWRIIANALHKESNGVDTERMDMAHAIDTAADKIAAL